MVGLFLLPFPVCFHMVLVVQFFRYKFRDRSLDHLSLVLVGHASVLGVLLPGFELLIRSFGSHCC